ncbi:MAG: hypothetical protein H7Z42_04890 [Roseiflexaceae bacterium]|nr:hypothetical protein [Roseiflexaceae bacterium]
MGDDEGSTDGACCCPPELDELDVLAAVDGEASVAVYAHLEQCSACASRAQQLRTLQGQLRQQLFRLFCPSSDELAACIQADTSGPLNAHITNHILGCPSCQSDLALLASIVARPPHSTPPPPLHRVIAQPQPRAPTKGHTWSQPDTRLYRAGTLRISLSLERYGNPLGLRLRGTLRGTRQRAITASLISSGRVISSTPLDFYGSFTLNDVPNGAVLSLRLPTYEIVVEALQHLLHEYY